MGKAAARLMASLGLKGCGILSDTSTLDPARGK